MTQAALLALAIVLPDGFPSGPVQTAVVCRGPSGFWPSPKWRSHASRPARVEAGEGGRCRVLARPSGTPFYVASREVVWRRDVEPIHLDASWLRTVRVDQRADHLTWIAADDGERGECGVIEASSECHFLPWNSAGVLLGRSDRMRHVAILEEGSDTAQWTGGAGRLVRVHSPAGAPVEARALRLERSLRRGANNLLEARAAPGIDIVPVGRRGFWIAGSSPGAFIELRSGDAAPLRLPIASLEGAQDMALDVRLWPGEAIEGDVRGPVGPSEGATVILSRIVGGEGDSTRKEEDLPRERIAEVVTDASGRFRFPALNRERHELLAIHPVHGRARRIATPPDYPRLLLRPRARIRGRVLRNGIPIEAALVRVVPALETVAGVKNPLLLAIPSVQTGNDGRFEVNVPDEGRINLIVSSSDGAIRIELGDSSSLAEYVDVGDIRIEPAAEVEVTADLPAGCRLQGAGPLGTPGLSIVSAVPAGEGRWRFRPTMPGRWFFAATCGTEELTVEPPVVVIGSGHRQPIVLKVRR